MFCYFFGNLNNFCNILTNFRPIFSIFLMDWEQFLPHFNEFLANFNFFFSCSKYTYYFYNNLKAFWNILTIFNENLNNYWGILIWTSFLKFHDFSKIATIFPRDGLQMLINFNKCFKNFHVILDEFHWSNFSSNILNKQSPWKIPRLDNGTQTNFVFLTYTTSSMLFVRFMVDFIN